jgi:two-component system, response regulator PdtaR
VNRSIRIAVADDEPDMQEYYRRILPLLGHVVVAVAETGRELIEKRRDQHPIW